MDSSKIDRINELYHKSQSVGLTEEEKTEQAALKKEYLAAIRANLRSSLNNISIKEKDGSITDLGKKWWHQGSISSIKKSESIFIARRRDGYDTGRDRKPRKSCFQNIK